MLRRFSGFLGALGSAVLVCLWAPSAARADCAVMYDATSIVPPAGATNVPRDTIITTSVDTAPRLMRTDTGADVAVTRTPLTGAQQAYGWKATAPLPADTDFALDDGRTFHTIADGSSGPSVTRWQVKSSGYPGQGGCNSDSCAPFQIVITTARAGDGPGWFNLYVDKAGNPGAGASVAFLKDITDGPGAGERTVAIWGSAHVNPGDSLRLVPVDLSGFEGTTLAPAKFSGSTSGGCRAAGPSGQPRRQVSLAPWFFLLMITVVIRGRPRAR